MKDYNIRDSIALKILQALIIRYGDKEALFSETIDSAFKYADMFIEKGDISIKKVNKKESSFDNFKARGKKFKVGEIG
jgi:hypothetical protein